MTADGERRPVIAVFGSSEPVEGEPLYEQARLLGSLLAGAGYTVATGGYGGVMEGASRGARESGGRTLGVTCEIFPGRTPNPYLDEIVGSRDLFERTRRLIEPSSGFVVLWGKAGTLAELCLLWALQRAGCLDRHPVILLGGAWKAVIEGLREQRMLDDAQLEITIAVGSAAEAVAALGRMLAPSDGERP